MKLQENGEAELREIISKGRAIIVAGTGVSIGASFDATKNESHPQASWAGLLENGIEWLKQHELMDPDMADAQLKLLMKHPQTHHFISAAEDVTNGMGGSKSPHFARWLERTIGSIEAHDRRVLDALHALRLHGHLLATTNYDGLLLGDSLQLSAITWLNTNALIAAIRHWQTEKIIFLHGYWRHPDSVILDWKSYAHIAHDEAYRDDIAALWKTHTWVYVGCGMSGLSDPDFGLLLDRYGQRAREAGNWDFCLVLKQQCDEFQAYFDQHHFNIKAVSFGDSHSDLPRYLRSLVPPASPPRSPAYLRKSTPIPIPPHFYAEPDYIGSHQFVGRDSQLQELNYWAKRADPTNLLLYEAIGGNGKSMLTWEWTTKHAPNARTGEDAWAGRFWYSFYEKGAVMQDFCQRALAYTTRTPLEDLATKKTAELAKELLAQLHAKPWLIILDGLERVLVAYHRFDAAEVPDEEANAPSDKIINRNPCDAIRDEDNDLLRALTAATPSKILVSTRLTPRVLLNSSGQPITGVRHITLAGLRPPDGEKLLRSCGVEGASEGIQSYLTANCDNHPLVIGILGGLINNYLPARHNFDAWVADADGGAKLDLARLDLIQRRNHILHAALDALRPASRQLLSTISLLSESVGYDTLKALSPVHAYELTATVTDLERRGLLQYDAKSRRYDVHPVVRAVAVGLLATGEKNSLGQRVLDYFSSQQPCPWDKAQSLDDVANGLNVVRILLKLGRLQEAARAYRGNLATTLLFSIEAQMETLSLLKPFFPGGWGELPNGVAPEDASYLANSVANALRFCGEDSSALTAYGAALQRDIAKKNWKNVNARLRNIAHTLTGQTRLALARRVRDLDLSLARVRRDAEALFLSQLSLFADYGRIGDHAAADATWRSLDPLGRQWPRAVYRQGNAEYLFAHWQFLRGTLEEAHLAAAARLAQADTNRVTLRGLHSLTGMWRMEQGDWAAAATSFEQAVTMARGRRLQDHASETGLALAKFHIGQLADPNQEVERLSQLSKPMFRLLALFWLKLGEKAQAEKLAIAGYRWAWADGEPFVRRYELNKSAELLRELGVQVPNLPLYDPTKLEKLGWENDVVAAIAELAAQTPTSEPNEPKQN